MKHIYTVVMLLVTLALNAQDVHFSHIHASPTLMNPAMTGLFDGDLRLILNYRSQWNNFTNGFKTFAASADTKLMKIGKDDFIGGGIQVYKDVAGDLDFTTSYGGLSFSLLKSLDGKGKNYISFGLQSSYMSNSVNYANIIAHDGEPLIEGGSPDQINFWDISAGLGWFYAFDNKNMMYTGLSLSHINEPRVSFFEDGTGSTDILKYRNLTIHGGADIRLTDDISLKPNFVFKDQGPHREIMIGSFWKYKKLRSKLKQPASLYFGAWVRWYVDQRQDVRGTDAFIFAIRFDYKKMFITFSFDANVSSLRTVSAGNGGPELSIIKVFDYEKKRRRSQKVICPAFRY